MNISTEITTSEYYKFISHIINSRGQWNAPSIYWEGHHIIPKCLGGSGNTRQKHENIIRLTAAEHFMAHKLLVALFPDNSKLIYAFWAMCTLSDGSSIATAEEYEAAKILRNKTIGKDVQAKLIGKKACACTRAKHSQAQAGTLNGFYGKTHSDDSRKKLATATSKAVRHVNTGTIYKSSYEAAASLGISRVLINNCCRGKQASTMGGMMFEYVNPQDIERGILRKTKLTKYERRREIIELRTFVVGLNKNFPGILNIEDAQRIRKLATCENRHYLLELINTFSTSISERAFEDYFNGFNFNEQLNNAIRTTIRGF